METPEWGWVYPLTMSSWYDNGPKTKIMILASTDGIRDDDNWKTDWSVLSKSEGFYVGLCKDTTINFCQTSGILFVPKAYC